jgi:hypothetical protein
MELDPGVQLELIDIEDAGTRGAQEPREFRESPVVLPRIGKESGIERGIQGTV